MQAQFGRDVLGVVCLDEARKHRNRAKEIIADITEDTSKDQKHQFKQEARAEKQKWLGTRTVKKHKKY